MGDLFGTDGIRGVANRHPMTPEMALAIGRATVHVCRTRKAEQPRIVIGHDTRISSEMLEGALVAGIDSMGGNAFLAGTLPTPGIAFLARSMEMTAGIVISASHNPYEDNGIKLFSGSGFKLPDSREEEIERLVTNPENLGLMPTGSHIGSVSRITDASERYSAFCKATFPEGLDLEGMKIVLDCANGATYRTAPFIFESLGANVTAIHCNPNGTNINDSCGSQHTQSLSEKVRELHAHAGLAFDGDGDRLIAVDESGREINGDQIMAICCKTYKDRGWLKNNRIVLTVMSNFGFRMLLESMGVDCEIAPVGDRYVMEMMQSSGAILGGEASGHIIFMNHHTSGDGIISALQLLATMRFTDQPLSQLSQILQLYPQKIINVKVSSKPPLDSINMLQTAVQAAESELGRQGRALIRYSGTQSLCRVMVEAPTEESANRLALSLADVVRQCVG